MTAHDEDPFEYGDDGKPVGVKATAVNPTLTAGELHDVVVAASAANEFESIALIDVLDQAGIPAMKRGGIIHLGSSGPCEVLVPRKLLDAARIEIERFRAAATERGVEEAFNPENVEEQWNDPKCDELTADMHGLASIPLEDRKARLADYVTEWMAEGRLMPEIAQYLAAAGLERADAEEVIQHAQSDRKEILIEKLQDRIFQGICIAILGALLTVGTFLFSRYNFGGPTVIIFIGPIPFFSGLFMALQAKSKLNEIQRGER